MSHDFQQFHTIEKTAHLNYLRDFRVEQCQLFLQHKCTQHRPFTCFYWHFQNQRRRRPYRRIDGTFSYDPDFYCNDYDEQTGLCPKGDDCPFLHRNANDTERRYHLRYFKTGICTHETDVKGHCLKNGLHCSSGHGANDLRQPVLDSRELQNSDLALERLARLCLSLESERALNDDPKWTDSHYVLAHYKTEPCKRPPRLCRQGYACPQYHNPRDRRRNPSIFKYKSTPCPHVKQSDEWIDPTVCDAGDSCKCCHTRTEQQFHPEIYKSTKCNDVSVTSYCPRGPFCAFAHIEQELKSYRDFDLHHPTELALSSFIPIPEDKEVGPDVNSTKRNNFIAANSYPPFFSSISSHFHSINATSNNETDEQILEGEVKNLIGSSLTAIGLDQFDENDFDKASSNGTSTTITRPMNIPYSTGGKSPFETPNPLFDETLESPIDAPFPEPSTSSGNSSRPGELYRMAGFSQDLPIYSHSSPQSIFQRLNSTTTNSLSTSSSSSEIDLMRNRVLQMQALAMTEKETSEHWRREAEDHHRLALQFEAEKLQAIQQRDHALQQIEQMRHFLLHNLLLFPTDNDAMHWSIDDLHTLQQRVQEELTKLSLIEKRKTMNFSSPSRTIGPTKQQNQSKTTFIYSASKD